MRCGTAASRFFRPGLRKKRQIRARQDAARRWRESAGLPRDPGGAAAAPVCARERAAPERLQFMPVRHLVRRLDAHMAAFGEVEAFVHACAGLPVPAIDSELYFRAIACGASAGSGTPARGPCA